MQSGSPRSRRSRNRDNKIRHSGPRVVAWLLRQPIDIQNWSERDDPTAFDLSRSRLAVILYFCIIGKSELDRIGEVKDASHPTKNALLGLFDLPKLEKGSFTGTLS